MPDARFGIDGGMLYGLLVLEDAQIARVVSAIESIVADPRRAADFVVTTHWGRTIYVCCIRGFEISYTFHQSSNRVWFLDLQPVES